MGPIISQFLARRPFVPFRIAMSDGGKYDVVRPDFAEVRTSAVDVFRPKPNSPNGRERRAMLSIPHITSVQEIGDEPFEVVD